MNLTTIGDIRETFAYFAMAFVADIFLVLQMISLTIFLRCEKIKQSIFKTTYRIMVFLHALDIAQLLTWSFAIFMGVSGFYYEPYTELISLSIQMNKVLIMKVCSALCVSTYYSIYCAQFLLALDRFIVILKTVQNPANSHVCQPWQERLFKMLFMVVIIYMLFMIVSFLTKDCCEFFYVNNGRVYWAVLGQVRGTYYPLKYFIFLYLNHYVQYIAVVNLVIYFLAIVMLFITRKKYNTATVSSERKLFFISMIFFLFLLSAFFISDVIFTYIFHLHGDFQFFLLYYAINAVWILGCAMNPLIYYHSMNDYRKYFHQILKCKSNFTIEFTMRNPYTISKREVRNK